MKLLKRILKDAYRLVYSLLFGFETFNQNHDYFYMDGFMRRKIADKLGSSCGALGQWLKELDYENVFALFCGLIGFTFVLLINLLNPFFWISLYRAIISFAVVCVGFAIVYSMIEYALTR